MFFRRTATAFAVAAFIITLTPVRVLAAGTWPWPAGSDVSLGYGATYANADGKTCTHGGVDIPAEAGTTCRSCVAGRVIFSGPVPSGEGARATAVTVLASDGLKVTLLPLSDASVSVGSDVAAGDALGALASSGDISSAATHLHMSVRRGDRYIDPESLLAAPLAAVPSGEAAPPTGEPPAPQAPDAVAPEAPRTATGADGADAVPSDASLDARDTARSLSNEPATAIHGAAVTSAMNSALRSGAIAMGAVPKIAVLSHPAVPPLVRLGDTLSAVARAREGAAWWIVRLMLASAGIACVRPLLRSVRPVAAVRAERVRA